MITEKQGDLLTTLKTDKLYVVCHQVNCQYKMNSGLAKQIREQYPQHYEDYMYTPRIRLGQIISTHIKYDFIVGICGQEFYGYDGKQYTSYDALREGFRKIYQGAVGSEYTIAIPYRIGCDRGGGDWAVVRKIIEEELKDCNVEIWRLDDRI